MIEIRNATLIRSGARVLHDLSLMVAVGQHTAVLGPNGAGKSSLIRMLTLEDRPRAADHSTTPLRLFGRASWDVTELRTRLGVVTGDLDAAFGLGTSGGRVNGADAALSGLLGSQGVFAHHEVTPGMRRQALDALERVDARHLASKPLNEMSAGERRRVLIARALISTPDALVLDEPTAGLDPVARHRFMESVRRLARQGTTLILVTHHIDEIIPEIKRVVLLRQGTVAFDGRVEDALTSQQLGTVFGGAVLVERSRGYYYLRPSGVAHQPDEHASTVGKRPPAAST